MNKLIELLFNNPILLFVGAAWLIGIVSNALKAKKKAGERTRQRQGVEPQPRRQASRGDVAAQAEGRRPDLPESGRSRSELPESDRSRSELPESGRSRPVMDPAPVIRQPASGPAAASPQRQQSADDVAREMRRILGLEPRPQQQPERSGAPAWPEPQAAPVERPPQRPRPAEPARRSSPERRGTHVDPHVGEGIRDRHMDRSKFDGRNVGRGFGSLGGRVKKVKQRARAGARYSLDDLKTAFVMSEILSPPVSLRPFDSRRP